LSTLHVPVIKLQYFAAQIG